MMGCAPDYLTSIFLLNVQILVKPGFHMIATIVAIVAIIWKPGFKRTTRSSKQLNIPSLELLLAKEPFIIEPLLSVIPWTIL